MDSKSLKKELQESIQEAQWTWLAPHHLRGALIIVSQDLDLIEVGFEVAQDSVEKISSWMSSGLMLRPTEAQLRIWESTPEMTFRFLILQPYVLVQPLDH
jgi:hypothetical protein